MPSTRPGVKLQNSRQLSQVQDGYFLFFKFRIATIKRAVVKAIINSSYVLIIINPFPQDSERVRARPPAARLNILYCQGAVIFRLIIENLYYLLKLGIRIFYNLNFVLQYLEMIKSISCSAFKRRESSRLKNKSIGII